MNVKVYILFAGLPKRHFLLFKAVFQAIDLLYVLIVRMDKCSHILVQVCLIDNVLENIFLKLSGCLYSRRWETG